VGWWELQDELGDEPAEMVRMMIHLVGRLDYVAKVKEFAVVISLP
jgi:hypothetical protein